MKSACDWKWFAFGFLFLGLFAIYLHTSRGSGGHAALWLETDRIDLGEIPSGGSAKREISLHNKGTSPLTITGIKVSCGCAEAKLDNPTIGPGESAPLSVVVKGKLAPGTSRESVHLFLNGEPMPAGQIELIFSSGNGIHLEPSSMDCGVVPRAKLPYTQSANLVVVGSGIDPDSLRVDTTEPPLRAQLNDTTDRTVKRLTVTLPAEAPSGQVAAAVTVTDRDRKIFLRLDVHGYIRGGVQVVPKTLILGPVRATGKPISQQLAVRGRRGRVEITSVTAGEPLKAFLRLQVKRKSPDELEVEVSVNQEKLPRIGKRQPVTGIVTLNCTLDGSVSETVAVPVTVVIQPS